MGMQSLRFGKPRAERDKTTSRPPPLLTFGLCLLVGAAVIAIMLGAIDLGLIDTISNLMK